MLRGAYGLLLTTRTVSRPFSTDMSILSFCTPGHWKGKGSQRNALAGGGGLTSTMTLNSLSVSKASMFIRRRLAESLLPLFHPPVFQPEVSAPKEVEKGSMMSLVICSRGSRKKGSRKEVDSMLDQER